MNEHCNGTTVRHLLDACYDAKKITESLPPLPDDLRSRHLHILHKIHLLQQETGSCRVSDVSRSVKTTMPSITKVITELSERKLLNKYPDPNDKRAVRISLTNKGSALVQRYVLNFHERWAENMTGVTPEMVQQAICVLTAFQQAMPESNYIEKGEY
ncbi:MAG: MarR family transcriptional regulator [Lachnospiraceae bacterium]|nr:MarR family transcriptional regulator [Lachnospiraceae bacterium]